MGTIFKNLAACIFLIGFLINAKAESLFTITPEESNVTIGNNGNVSVNWTVTSNADIDTQPITVNVIANYTGGNTLPSGTTVSLQNNTCTSLASGASCTFSTLIQLTGQPRNFQIAPEVCALNFPNCSYASSSLKVNAVYAYIATNEINNTPGTASLTPINLGNFASGTPLSGFSSFGTGVAVSPDGQYVYFTDNTNKEFKIASAGDAPALIGSLSLPDSFYFSGIAVTPDQKTVYLCDVQGNVVYVIDVQDPANPTLITSISTLDWHWPSGITINASGTRAYVAGADDEEDGAVYVIDTSTNTIIKSYLSLGPVEATAIAISPDGNTLVDTQGSNGAYSVINLQNDAVTSNIVIGPEAPSSVVFSPDGTKIYLAATDYMNNNQAALVIINASDPFSGGSLIYVGGSRASGIATSPDGNEVFIITDTGVSVTDANGEILHASPISLPNNAAPIFEFGNFIG